MRAWHFTGNTLRDGSPIPPVGVKLVSPVAPIMCQQGLHASLHPFDALQHAPGQILHLVDVDRIVTTHNDKVCCWDRTIIASMNATDMLRYYARMQALSVVHLWNAPDVVLDWIMTGDDAARDAARAAAWDAAWVAARDDFALLVNECFEEWL